MIRKLPRSIEIFIALGVTIVFVALAQRAIGINVWDDSSYLRGATWVRPNSLVTSSWSPLYLYWFKALALLFRNPITRYFASWCILVGLVGMIPTFMKIPLAWLYTILIFAFPFVTVDPFVSLFASAILLVGLGIQMRLKLSVSDYCVLSCCTSFVVSFARSEFQYGVLVIAVTTLAIVALEALRPKPENPVGLSRRGYTQVTAVLVMALLTIAIMHLTLGNRSGMAFAQHFNQRAWESGKIAAGEDPGGSSYAEKTFGIDTAHNALTGTASIGDFFRANPGLFLNHILRNLFDFRTMLFLLILGALVIAPWFVRGRHAMRVPGVVLLFLALPVCVDLVIIYPRDHYAIILLPSMVLYSVQLVESCAWIWKYWAGIAAAGIASVLLFNTAIQPMPRTPYEFERDNLRGLQCVREVDKLTSASNPLVFDSVGDPAADDIYYVHERRIVYPSELPDWSAFKSWATANKPEWITADSGISKRYEKTPEEIDQFLRGDLGYAPHVCELRPTVTVYTSGAH